ncbi:MAG: phosphatidylserine decarboxylase [Clostridia bacterium]|nr:phosphatidylserine decarboxylase [Clostridia bacterium]
MKMKRRDGTVCQSENGQQKMLGVLYGTKFGRMLLKPLTAPWISCLAGRFLSTGLSCVFIGPFIRKNHIDMTQYEEGPFASYNAFFARHIREGARHVDMQKDHLISPADSKLTVLPIKKDGRFIIKHTEYTVASLLKNEELARTFEGGQMLIFRLTVDDYHRYCYMADGEKEDNVYIPGKFHTVNPIANDYFPIYKENAREYTLLHTAEFGDMVIMEVGALLVGKIKNHHGKQRVHRGEEKGYFEFGGSTVVVLVKKDAVLIDEDLVQNSRDGCETVVRLGEKIGCKAAV